MPHGILTRMARLGMATAISLAPLTVAGGCGSSRPADVPKTASLKTQGNDRVVYTADDNGRVWIADHGTNDILYSGYLGSVHDTIDDVTRTAEDIHKSVADLPLELLGRLTSLETTLEPVRDGQARSIAAVYNVVRQVNARVRKLTTAAAS